jgi:hypothetical protein
MNGLKRLRENHHKSKTMRVAQGLAFETWGSYKGTPIPVFTVGFTADGPTAVGMLLFGLCHR